MHLTLQESYYSLPLLTYAIAAIKLITRQQREIIECLLEYNGVQLIVRFQYRWESIKSCIWSGVSRLNLRHIIIQRGLQFHFHIRFSK